jgi:hypothetical protein
MGFFNKGRSELLTFRMSCFNIGNISVTPSALTLCESLGISPKDFVQRHASGDFGLIDQQQRERNQMAIQDARLDAVSTYSVGTSVIYVVTQQGVATTVMSAQDYLFYAQGR